LATIVLPSNYLTSHPSVEHKLDNIAFWRPDFQLEIRLNGTLMHYGRLLVCWYPQAELLPTDYFDFQGASGHKWVQVSANQRTPIYIDLPYSHYKDVMDVREITPDLFTVRVFAATPLRSVNGTPAPIPVTIFARVTKTNFFGYTTNTFTVVTQSAEAEEKTQKGNVISSTLGAVARVASSLTFLPKVGPVAGIVSAVAALGSGVARALGFSVPINVAAISPIQVRMPRIQQMEDLPHTIALGPTADGVVDVDYRLVNDTVQAADLLFFMQRPFLVNTMEIRPDHNPGDIVANVPICPSFMNYQAYDSPPNPADYHPSPVAYCARLARLWRGSLRFHFSVVASGFHSMRYQLSYLPYFTGASVPVITLADSNSLVKRVVDINNETETSITIPYLQPTPWLPTFVSRTEREFQNKLNGVLYVQILNKLTSGQSTVEPIYVQMFVSAGDDFQLACPSTENCESLGWTHGTVFTVDAQSGDVPSLTEQGLREVRYTPVVAGARDMMIPEKVFNQVHVRSVKGLTNMVSPFVSLSCNANTWTAHSVNPWQWIGSGVKYNFMSNMTIVFRYLRGGTRWVAPTTVNNGDFNGRASLTTPATSFTAYDVTNTTSFKNMSQSIAIFNDKTLTPCDVTIPWFSNFKCIPTNLNAELYGTLVNVGTVGVFSPDTRHVVVHGGGGDDFLLGWQLAPPRMKGTDL
jgi:hypothetical protein